VVRFLRTKLLVVVGVALFMGMISAAFFSLKTNRMLNEQANRQGAYIAASLASNSEYGVLTADRSLLGRVVEGTMRASEDVVAVVIRDAQGKPIHSMIRNDNSEPVVARGAVFKSTPGPRGKPLYEAQTVDGEPVTVFRAEVHTTPPDGDRGRTGDVNGSVEVAIGKKLMTEQTRRLVLTTFLLTLALFLAGSAVCWFLMVFPGRTGQIGDRDPD
jgi:hypothetical protein